MYHVDGEVNHREKTMADIYLERMTLKVGTTTTTTTTTTNTTTTTTTNANV